MGDRARQGSRAEKLRKKRTDRTEVAVSASPDRRYDRYGQRDLGVLLRNVRYGRSWRLGYPELSHLPGVGPLGNIVNFFEGTPVGPRAPQTACSPLPAPTSKPPTHPPATASG